MFHWNDSTYWVKETTKKQKIKAIVNDIIFVILGVTVYTGFFILLILLWTN